MSGAGRILGRAGVEMGWGRGGGAARHLGTEGMAPGRTLAQGQARDFKTTGTALAEQLRRQDGARGPVAFVDLLEIPAVWEAGTRPPGSDRKGPDVLRDKARVHF